MVVLFSGGASGARYLFEEAGLERSNYEIVAGIADKDGAPGIEEFAGRDIPVKVVNKKEFYSYSDPNEESIFRYFDELASIVEEFEPNLLLLSGFMQVVREPLLTKYAGQIINVHPADLRIKEHGNRKYRGDDSVYQAIIAGENETRSTVHFVTKRVDEGPIIVVSRPVPIEKEMVRTFERFNQSMVRNYANLLQEWMKWSCDGPSIQKALALFAKGKVRLSHGEVTIKGPDGLTSGYYDLKEGRVVTVEDERS
ncbi:MAG: phosphoribosylglycinamide formyltransferase [Candidatus Bipolaricaulota bacterium]